ncbi:uncharacterized protein LOC144687674 isoform X2 [Cetorhinus maximus]
MGSSPSLPAWEIRNLANTTGFTSEQIEILHRRFLHLTDGKDTMCKDCFDNIPDLECNPIKSRIVNAFFDKRNLGLQSIGTVDEITFENFLITLSFFQHMDNSHSKEDLEYYKTEKLRFLFRMYDTNGDGKITLDELREEPDQVYDGITFNDFFKIYTHIGWDFPVLPTVGVMAGRSGKYCEMIKNQFYLGWKTGTYRLGRACFPTHNVERRPSARWMLDYCCLHHCIQAGEKAKRLQQRRLALQMEELHPYEQDATGHRAATEDEAHRNVLRSRLSRRRTFFLQMNNPRCLHMSRDVVAYICLILQDLTPQGLGGHPLPVAVKITAALNFNATGSFQGSTGDLCGISSFQAQM